MLSDLFPNPYAIGVAAVVPSLLSRTQDWEYLKAYGLVGEVLRLGLVAFALLAVM